MDRPPSSRAARFAESILRHRWAVIFATVLAVIGLATGAGRLGFNDDYRLFFGPDNPQLQAFEALQKVYTKNDNILFVVEPTSGEVFTPTTLAAIEDLTEASWQIPFARRVDSVTNFQHTYAEEDDLIVEDLVEGAGRLAPEAIASARSIALAEPLLRDRILSGTADVTAVNVTLQMPGESVDETQAAVAHARELAQRIESDHPGHTIRLTGFTMLNNAFSESAQHDMATLVPVMYGAIIVFLLVLFRSLSATVSTLFVIALSTVAAMGAAGGAGHDFTPPSSIAPTLILTLAVADSVHLLKGFLVRLAAGDGKHRALIESMRVNLWPIFLTSASTAIGFLSMNFSDSPPFHDLGNITAFGVMAKAAMT
ncbi:MAG: MMPL family transporter, partial [Acidobacteriota bacterium]